MADFVKAVKKEVVPALGCTEPISLAFAAAVAASKLGKPVERIEAKCQNLMKNGMGVTVPGTGTHRASHCRPLALWAAILTQSRSAEKPDA